MAAYFAASDAYRAFKEKKVDETDVFEVYALSREVFDTRWLAKRLGIDWAGGELKLVTAPTESASTGRRVHATRVARRSGDPDPTDVH